MRLLCSVQDLKRFETLAANRPLSEMGTTSLRNIPHKEGEALRQFIGIIEKVRVDRIYNIGNCIHV